jgi:predicted lipoprotein
LSADAGRRVPLRLGIVLGACAVLAVLWFAGLVATVRPIHGIAAENANPNAGADFDPKAYVASIWAPKVVPAAKQGVDLAALLTALAQSPNSTLAKSGHEVAGTDNFLVHFTGTVTAIDTSSPIGVMTVAVKSGQSTVPVKVEIGPVILGTALRDSLKFISFEEFLNQIQYGGVADALNAQVVQQVLAKLDVPKLKGTQVTIDGAFAEDRADAQDVTVTPVVVQTGASNG